MLPRATASGRVRMRASEDMPTVVIAFVSASNCGSMTLITSFVNSSVSFFTSPSRFVVKRERSARLVKPLEASELRSAMSPAIEATFVSSANRLVAASRSLKTVESSSLRGLISVNVSPDEYTKPEYSISTLAK